MTFDCILSRHAKAGTRRHAEPTVQSTYVFGLLIVPLRLLILVIISKSLKRKKPRSFLPPWPCGIETKSNSKKCRSHDTRSEIPSMTPCKCSSDIFNVRSNYVIVVLVSSEPNSGSEEFQQLLTRDLWWISWANVEILHCQNWDPLAHVCTAAV